MATVIKARIIAVESKKDKIKINDYQYTWYGDKNIYKEAQDIARKLYKSR